MRAGRRTHRCGTWNHNIHYHLVVFRALPADCKNVLEVGCGEGALARELSRVVPHVTAIDRDSPIIDVARTESPVENIDYVVGDFMTHAFEPASFDAVASIATLHHMDMAPALDRMRTLLRPGGTLAVVGLARSRHPMDLPLDAAGVIGTRLRRLREPYREVKAPTVWPPPTTYRQAKRSAERVLPGVRYRRHMYFRFSLLWQKPVG